MSGRKPYKFKIWGAFIPVAFFLLLMIMLRGENNPENMKSPDIKIVQLTDLHYAAPPRDETDFSWLHHVRIMGYKLHKKNLAESRDILEAAVNKINEEIRPDMVVVTGDLVDNTEKDKKKAVNSPAPRAQGVRRLQIMKEVKQLLDNLDCPYYTVIGDHDLDTGKNLRRSYGKVFGEINYSARHRGWNLIFLGVFPGERELEWLEKQLAGDRRSPTVVFMHRMLVASPLMRLLSGIYVTSLLCPSAEEILDILDRSDNVKAVICGHSHTNYTTRHNGVLHMSTASLIEPPYEFRSIKFYEDGISSRLRRVPSFE